ncbi:tRNA pseudouridine synthase A [Thalassobaculum fulvum]|uniref:tRNA pseudouridine synthase A n=1 Tax=Thalassobaculum fulvum TaxID=1633335 RepID=A0A919CR98_9PROT|nr:tRNA pseudouridine(38-40) synthase TruA [Thalassobaculum fulvum]GHD56592.1 tRNA pseudouridine synthase A [Thalassobaculum fulvum]
MPRFRLTIEYDGAPFVGWQRQDNGPSVQASLEDAVLAFSGERVEVVGAGRTDTGVHAEAQVAHLDLASERFEARTVMNAVNAHLRPLPVAVLAAEAVGEDFHARFSAVWRAYRYVIVNRRAPLALDLGRAWHVMAPLDVAAMQAGADRLLGHHDFTSFRAVQCQAKSPLKTLDLVRVSRHGERVVVEAKARSFLHHQVRNIVGTLKLVGEGKWRPDDVTRALEARDRTAAGPTAPADGLTLVAVGYPD